MENGVLGPLEARPDRSAPQKSSPARARRFDSPLVGREQQLGVLRSAFASVVHHRACRLLTVLGPAGIGKSRLVQQFADDLGEEATVLHGHCLPYGEGITYWPLTEVVREILRSKEGVRRGVVERCDRRAPARRGQGRPDRRADLRRARSRQRRCRHRRGDLVGGAQALRGDCAAPPARDRLRRPAVGRADVPGARRVPGRAIPRRSHPAALHGASRALRQPSRLGGRQDRGRADAARAARRRRLPDSGREPARPRATARRRGDADRRGGRRQRAVRRGAAGNAGRRRPAELGRRTLGGGGRPARRPRAHDVPHAARRPARRTAQRRARPAGTGVGRGRDLPPQCVPRARPRRAGHVHRAQPGGARAPRRDPARHVELRG